MAYLTEKRGKYLEAINLYFDVFMTINVDDFIWVEDICLEGIQSIETFIRANWVNSDIDTPMSIDL